VSSLRSIRLSDRHFLNPEDAPQCFKDTIEQVFTSKELEESLHNKQEVQIFYQDVPRNVAFGNTVYQHHHNDDSEETGDTISIDEPEQVTQSQSHSSQTQFSQMQSSQRKSVRSTFGKMKKYDDYDYDMPSLQSSQGTKRRLIVHDEGKLPSKLQKISDLKKVIPKSVDNSLYSLYGNLDQELLAQIKKTDEQLFLSGLLSYVINYMGKTNRNN
jgi:hypothetical protein